MVNQIRSYFRTVVVDKYKITFATLIPDLTAGLTVALVLIPQSLAYAQLAGLPAHYGLYASFLPLIIGALFGSSRFLSTGPVAVVSLITASVLSSISVNSPSELIVYAVLLALIVGIIQLLLGILKLGVIVNFISHPVIIGFTNAAAIIIAVSQLPKVFGVSSENYEHFYQTVYHFIIDAARFTHLVSVLIALVAYLIIFIIKQYNPRLPAILIAVVVCTLLSLYIHFEQKQTIPLSAISSVELRESITAYNDLIGKDKEKTVERNVLQSIRTKMQDKNGYNLQVLDLDSRIAKLDFERNEFEHQIYSYRNLIRYAKLSRESDHSSVFYYSVDSSRKTLDFKELWRISVGENAINPDKITIHTGGSVIGKIPAGIPAISIPQINIAAIPSLFNAALIIAVLGFMESIAIARSLAIRVGDKIDPNRELVGQGLANIIGAFSQSYPVAGSFSRTAVNYQGGAQTVFASVATALFVLLTLLFFTPLLYHLPQPALAVIIISSVSGLINLGKIREAWKTNHHEGIITVITLVSTLFFAPHLDKGIMLGVLLSTGYYIYTRTRPRIVQLSGDKRDILHDINLYQLKPCEHMTIIRFDGSLFFANAAYLEDKLEKIVNNPNQHVRAIIFLADGINYIDYSGIETLSQIAKRYKEAGIRFIIAAMKSHIVNVIRDSHEIEVIGEKNIIRHEREAISKVYAAAHKDFDEKKCPLKGYVDDSAQILPYIK